MTFLGGDRGLAPTPDRQPPPDAAIGADVRLGITRRHSWPQIVLLFPNSPQWVPNHRRESPFEAPYTRSRGVEIYDLAQLDRASCGLRIPLCQLDPFHTARDADHALTIDA